MMKRRMKQISLLIVLLIGIVGSGRAQNERKFIRQGNKYFMEAMKDTAKSDTALFNKAEIEYRKALDKKPDNPQWEFNLGDALYKQKKFGDSGEKFKSIADHTNSKIDKARALYNMGNSLLMDKKLDESIAAYKESLRNNPNDLEAKYNLLYAENLKKKQQQKQNQDKQNQDKNKDQKNKDQNKDKNQQNKDQQNKDQQKQDQQKQNQDQKNQNQNQQQQQQGKISQQNAEQMLQALENNEKKIQEKVKKEQALKAKSKVVDKNW